MPDRAEFIPIRLCCGERHFGPVCPDGLVMCCLCFQRVPQERLNVTDDGSREDVCQSCAADEAARGSIGPNSLPD